MKTILLTGAGGSACANVAFALRRNYRLVGVDINPRFLHLNDFVREKHVVPRCSDPSYLDKLNEIIESTGADLVWPQPDPEVGVLSESRSKLKAPVWLPSDDVVKACQDKNLCLKKWAAAGLRELPVMVAGENDAASLKFPLWLRAIRGAGGKSSALCKTRAQLLAWLTYLRENNVNDVMQAEEYLPGRDYCFSSIWKDGRLLTSYARERLGWIGTRSVGAGGTSSINRMVHSDAVNDASVAAIMAVDEKPEGVYNVDLKEDASGKPKPTEVNIGRWVTNVIFSNLAAEKYDKPEWNYPEIAVKLALGEPVPKLEKFNALPAELFFVKNVDMGYKIFTEGELPK
ncbi:hypothetical protein HZC09_02510 [Candidatus Micrarchaeota archaeon]|nr:hypothetical protein [Candidatus Micrarchaeota archaeon]